MDKLFDRSKVLDCDCYVADYSELTNNAKKVVIRLTPLNDISYFHLHKSNQNKIPYLAVNLEDYPAFNQSVQNCECVFKALNKDDNSWLMFLELKYCKEENIELYSFKAYTQMDSILSKLEELGVADRNKNNIYFVYSVPDYPDKVPFGAWTISQNDVLKGFEASGIHLIGECKMLIATPKHLKTPKIRI